MALVRNNSLTEGISGAVGDMIVFKQLNGKTYFTAKPRKPTKQSELQKENRSKFREASMHAKLSMLDPEKKAYYWMKAKKLNLPNAYTAAIADFMRKGEIKEIDARNYKGSTGDSIRIKVTKKDFAVQNVTVTLHDAQGNVLESNKTEKKETNIFLYKTNLTLEPQTPITIRVMIGERRSNKVVKEIVVNC